MPDQFYINNQNIVGHPHAAVIHHHERESCCIKVMRFALRIIDLAFGIGEADRIEELEQVNNLQRHQINQLQAQGVLLNLNNQLLEARNAELEEMANQD